jgi:fatty-acyl-CoA synthase
MLSCPADSIFETGLDRNPANYVPLTPVSFMRRAARVFPDRVALIHGERRYSYAEFEQRCRRLASALSRRGVGPGDTVAIMAPNIPAIIEAHYAVPGIGAVLNPLNIRLDARTIRFILAHGEAKLVMVDREFSSVIQAALRELGRDIPVIDIDDLAIGGERIGSIEYEALLAEGDPAFELQGPADEWQALILSYTSGTTGDPKGVVYHHRGAYLNSLSNVAAWAMQKQPVLLWTLPIFHSLGWCFPWTIPIMGGTQICLRKVEAKAIFDAISDHAVTHLCGAPVVMNTLVNARADEIRTPSRPVHLMTAASAPPPAVIEKIERLGFEVLHVYGLTEVFGPSTICEWQPEWDGLSLTDKAAMKARQGVPYPTVETIRVVDRATMRDVAADGVHLGEVVKRANTIMRGYLKNEAATAEAFAGGWFHTGDLGVMHPDGYIQLRDRSKDIIISGGENISTIEVEDVLYRHPAVLEAAVVARPDERWGETPCAFVALREGAEPDEAAIIAFCREHLAHFKAPRSVVFGPLPKTSTGKVQKFMLRERARSL